MTDAEKPTSGDPTPRWETAARKISTSSNRISRSTKEMTVLGMITVGLCGLLAKFDSVLRKDSKEQSQSSSRVRLAISTSSEGRERKIRVTRGHPLPGFSQRGLEGDRRSL